MTISQNKDNICLNRPQNCYATTLLYKYTPRPGLVLPFAIPYMGRVITEFKWPAVIQLLKLFSY